MRIHDGDYWSHALLRNGAALDRFATMPDYFTDDPAEVARLTAKYAGQPALVAETIGCPVEQVAPYLVQVDVEDGEDEENPRNSTDGPRTIPPTQLEMAVWPYGGMILTCGHRLPGS